MYVDIALHVVVFLLMFTRGNAYHYTDATIFAQQTTPSYLEANPQQQNLISAAVTAPGAVSSGQTYLQVTQSGTTIQTQRHPITHTTRASPATVSSFTFTVIDLSFILTA